MSALPVFSRDEFTAPEAQDSFIQQETQPFLQNPPQEEILLDEMSNFKYKIGVKKIKRIGAHDIEKKQDLAPLSFKYKDLRFDSYASKGVGANPSIYTLEQRSNLSYKKGIFDLSGGVENYYGSADLTKASQSFYFTPKLNITKNAYVQLNNKVDPKNNNFYQELGVNYTPHFLKNSSFGVLGGVNYYGNNKTTSERLKFNTSFYLW